MFSRLLNSAAGYPHFIFHSILFMSMIFLGEEALLVFGAFSRLGYVHFWDAFLIALAGVFVGDMFWFTVGEKYGEEFVKKYGKWLFITPLRFHKLKQKIKKSGGIFIFISKFIYNMNHVSLIAAGAVKFDFANFVRWQIPTSVVWTLSFLGLGYFFADNLAVVKHDVKVATIFLAVVVILFLFIDKIISKIVEKGIMKLPDFTDF